MTKWLRYALLIVFCILVGDCVAVEVDEQEDKRGYYLVEEVDIISDENGWDLPANDGIKNALLNAEQLANIEYRVLADFNRVGGCFSMGSSIKGLVYSSTRAEDLFVPNNVSLWTFMTALKNPNSYVYTIDITQQPYLIQGYAKPFYGQVCTSLIQYSLGIKYNFQIHQMTVWDGFDRLISQDIEKIRLGDILTTERGHTRFITGIHRECGHVTEIEITEGMSPCVTKRVYPVKEVVKSLEEEKYVIYRYRYINNTDHTPSPFVAVGDEPSVTDDILSDMDVIPRRGDKANWRMDEDVVLDVVSRRDYSGYILEKDGQVIENKRIPENNVLNFGRMPFGSYTLFLKGESGDSRPVYWKVVDYAIKVQTIGKGKVLVSYLSKNAKPVWLTWRRPAKENSQNNNMPLWTTIIDGYEGVEGKTVSELDSYISNKFGLGEWDFKVAFETQYGIISSDSVTANVNSY